jgi:hypothetical protein
MSFGKLPNQVEVAASVSGVWRFGAVSLEKRLRRPADHCAPDDFASIKNQNEA